MDETGKMTRLWWLETIAMSLEHLQREDLMGSEREKLDEARAIVLRLKTLEEEGRDAGST